MKKVNLTPELELKKAEIMQQFNENDELDQSGQLAEQLAGQPAATDSAEPAANETILNDDQLKEKVIDALKTVYDPEIPVNIFDLGLIYGVRIENGFADIEMTLTTPGCPVAHTFPGMVERSVCLVPGINGAAVEIVWDPPWTPELISEAARLELGLI